MASDKMVLAEYERCIVRVLKNGQTVGAGLVLEPGRILTCLHVVGRKNDETFEMDSHATLSIEFYACAAAGRTMAPLSVTVDNHLWNSGLSCDLAILNWPADGKLPEGVRSADFCQRSDQKGTSIFCRGFPVGIFESYPAVGSVTADTSRKNQMLWTLDAKSIHPGFSGGPVFNANSGDVIGITKCIKRPENDLRCIGDAFAIPVKAIAEFCRPFLTKPFDDRGRAAVQRLRDEVEAILSKANGLQTAFWRNLAVSAEHPQSGPRGLADYLLGASMSLDRFVDVACKCWDDLSRGQKPPKKDLTAAAQLYTLVISQVLDRDLVKQLREHLEHGKRFKIVPYSNRGIIALLIAGADGRLGSYKKKTSSGKWRGLPVGEHEIELPADKGITMAGAIVPAELDRVIVEGLGQSRDSFGADCHKWLDEALRERENSGKRLFLIVDSDTSSSQNSIANEIQQRYPHLTVLQSQPTDNVTEEARAIAPWINKKLLPYWR